MSMATPTTPTTPIFKFKLGERVVVKNHVYYGNQPLSDHYLGGLHGTVLVMWPKAVLNASHQIHVEVDGWGPLVFEEDQLDYDVLWKLASL